jgi:hypothetical protein
LDHGGRPGCRRADRSRRGLHQGGARGKAEELAEQTDTQDVVSEATAQALGQAPFALLGTLATAPGGATTLLPVIRLLARNLPLVLLLVMIGALFWPSQSQSQQRLREAGEVEEEEDLSGPIPLRPVA